MNPLVSVIVPVYNVERHIEKCVISLMEQTLDDIEYIFIDDCSTDCSRDELRKVLDKYPQRKLQVKILQQEKNSGSASARALGFSHSTGEYIIYCDSDDWVDKDMYKIMYETAVTSDADIVSCDFYMALNSGNKIYFKTPEWCGLNHSDNLKSYIVYPWNVLWNVLVKRSVYDRLLKDDNDALKRTINLKITYCEDFHLIVRLLFYANTIIKVNLPLYYYNQTNAGSIMRNFSRKNMYEEQKSYLDIIEWFKQKGEYDTYRKELAWRILKSKQELILDYANHSEFLDIHPDSHNFIFSCPYINLKQKFMIWGLTHNCSFITYSIIFIRNLKEKLK